MEARRSANHRRQTAISFLNVLSFNLGAKILIKFGKTHYE